MTIIEAATAALEDSDFRRRCEFLTVKSAVAISNESANVFKHEQRIALARRIMTNPDALVTTFALASLGSLLAFPNVQAIPDGDLETTINAVWNSVI